MLRRPGFAVRLSSGKQALFDKSFQDGPGQLGQFFPARGQTHHFALFVLALSRFHRVADQYLHVRAVALHGGANLHRLCHIALRPYPPQPPMVTFTSRDAV